MTRFRANGPQFVRYLVERGHLNEPGQQAMVAACEIDRKAERLPTDAPRVRPSHGSRSARSSRSGTCGSRASCRIIATREAADDILVALALRLI